MAMKQGVYVISVAARLLDMHPQTLRKYERVGLIMPSRTRGMSRLYSEEDIARLKLIKHLVEDLGLNHAGVHLAIELFNRIDTDAPPAGRTRGPASQGRPQREPGRGDEDSRRLTPNL